MIRALLISVAFSSTIAFGANDFNDRFGEEHDMACPDCGRTIKEIKEREERQKPTPAERRDRCETSCEIGGGIAGVVAGAATAPIAGPNGSIIIGVGAGVIAGKQCKKACD